MRATEWLEKTTGRSASWWMSACQTAVGKSLTKGDDPAHDDADPLAFLAEVIRLVGTGMPPDEPYDPNMRAACITSLVLGLWFSRLNYAKAHDPARPVSLRQRSYAKLMDWTLALQNAITDERDDAAYFGGQAYDFPFSFAAKDGDFV